MTKFDFSDYAANLAMQAGMEAMVPVIEKEILHYEILNSLDRQGILNLVSFQGGTCLRLCYGSPRYSEDLDFAAGDNLDRIDLGQLSDRLERSLTNHFDVRVRVREPSGFGGPSGVAVRRWWVVVDTAPARPDLPSQRIKIELAGVPGRTREVRTPEMHYQGIPATLGNTLVVCQKREEILADKLVSFSDSTGRVRYRDLWDIPWLMRCPRMDLDIVAGLVELKHEDYRCQRPLSEMMGEGLSRAIRELSSRAFAKEMERFLPPEQYGETVGRPLFLEVMIGQLEDAFRLVL